MMKHLEGPGPVCGPRITYDWVLHLWSIPFSFMFFVLHLTVGDVGPIKKRRGG